MSIIDIFSKRKRQRKSTGKVEPYKYDSLPQGLRIQVVHIWRTAIGIGDWQPAIFLARSRVRLANEVWETCTMCWRANMGVRALGMDGPDWTRPRAAARTLRMAERMRLSTSSSCRFV